MAVQGHRNYGRKRCVTAVRFFFAHSHRQHEFVKAVAARVGRPYVVLDEYNFETGKTFKTMMVEWLARCDAFVLFASRDALNSPNVLFEIDEAERSNLLGDLGRVIVFVIEEDVPYDALPNWLKAYNARRATSPRDCAREILHHARSIQEHLGDSLFFGRTRELEQLQAALVPISDEPPATAFSLYGLPGMGKRTLAARVGRDILQFPKHVVLPVAIADTPRELLALLDEEVGSSGPSSTPLEAASVEARCVARLETLVGLRTLPIIDDAGGLLTNDGDYNPGFRQVIDSFLSVPGSYLAITSRRKLIADPLSIPQLALVGLPKPDATRYLTKLASLSSVAATPGKLSELADYVAGYPVAARLAIHLARLRGLDMVLAQREQLVDFRQNTFVRILSADMKLNLPCRRALAVLWLYGPIPLNILATGMGIDVTAMSEQVTYLFDSALVDFDERGYRIIDPLYDVIDELIVQRDIRHADVASHLKASIAELDDDSRRLHLRRSLYRAEVMASLPITADAYRFTSDLYALAKRAYDEKRYEVALELALEARGYNPDNLDVLTLLAKSLMKSDRWTDATIIIDEIETRGHVRDAGFLRGFLLRNRGFYSAALKEFLLAWSRGLSNVPIHREIAFSAFRANDLELANKHIALAEERGKGNKYILDLQIEIATARGDEETAREKLRALKEVDAGAHYHHRKSIVEQSFGNVRGALSEALLAAPDPLQAPMSLLLQLARAQISNGKLEEAVSTLKQLERGRRPRDRAAVKLLRAYWELASSNVDAALVLLGNESFFDSAFWSHVRCSALKLALRTLPNDDPRREAFAEELQRRQ
jgi:tetratricopeptide (TPR) repeat protein